MANLPSEFTDWSVVSLDVWGDRASGPSAWSAWAEATTSVGQEPEPASPSQWTAWADATTYAEPHRPWKLITASGHIDLIAHVVE